jgi:hypothetical protein
MARKAKIKHSHLRVWLKTKTLSDIALKALNRGKKRTSPEFMWTHPKLINSAVLYFVKHNTKTRGDKRLQNFLNNKDSLNSSSIQEQKI